LHELQGCKGVLMRENNRNRTFMGNGVSGGLLMGIDLGSSCFKVDLFDADLHRVGGAAAPVVYDIHDNCVEMPVADCEQTLRRAIADAKQESGCSPSDICAVAFSSQAQTFTVRTPEGAAKIPFISWRDHRSFPGNPTNDLTELGKHCSTNECLPALTVSKLAGMRGLVKSDDSVLWLPTWFVRELTGRSAVDVNLAAMSGLYSLQSGDWWQSAMKFCNINPGNLPQLKLLGAVAGLTNNAAARYGLPTGIPVVLAGNDQTAGAYSAGIHESQSLLISLGTAQVAYLSLPFMPQPKPGTMRGDYLEDRYYQLTADDLGAGSISWACSVLPGCANPADFDRLAASAPAGCHGVRFVADGPAGSGHWIGIEHAQATTADKARAVLEILVERMADMIGNLNPLQTECGVLVCGGGAKSELWLSMLSSRLERPLVRTEAVSPSAGAAKMARNVLE